MNKIIIPELLWKKGSAFLYTEGYSRFLFFLCGINKTEKNVTFLVKDLICIKDEDVELSDDFSLQINLNALLQVTNQARKENLTIIEAHSHPFSKYDVTFSFTDLEGFEEFVPFILDDLKHPYGATVWGKESVDGILWKDSIKKSEVIHEVRIIGNSIKRIKTTSSRKIVARKTLLKDRASRQILAFGVQGQELLSKTSVAIIGLGGLGSQVAQQLAYLGVRDFILVDFDRVQPENLNRIVGARPEDVGKSKVDVAARMIKSIADKEPLKISKYERDLRDIDVLTKLKTCDLIFGCVDRDGPRLILNELALSYMFPYIDSAFGIDTKGGVIKEAGGRVVLVVPDGPCLLCCKEIDINEASYDLSLPEERKFQEERGYISGADVPSPSIISLDGIIASIAVTEFLALVTGFRPAKQYSCYNLMTQTLNQRLVKCNPKCVHCSIKGMGDNSGVMRYASVKTENERSVA